MDHGPLLAHCLFFSWIHTDVQVENCDVKLTIEGSCSLQTVSEDDFVWIPTDVNGVGKSTLGNFLLGKHVFEVRGGLEPVTEVHCRIFF